MRPRLAGFSLFAAALLFFCSSRSIRAQNPNGALRGVVQDISGRVIPAARIELHGRDFALERKTTTNNRGEFRIDELLPGNYQLLVDASGFEQVRSNVSVNVSAIHDVTVALKPRAVQEKVIVQGEASSVAMQPIDTSSAVHEAVITARDLQEIPLAERSFANIAFLAPGTEPVEPSDPTKARITAVSTGGSSGLNNQVSVDGGDNSDDWIGGFLQNFSPDAIQEFNMRTAQENADSGGTTAGSVVITTKHGTDFWHGSAGFYGRASVLNARFPIDNPAPNSKQPFSRENYVGTLGGPIVRNKLWLFSSFEYVHENASIAYSPASQMQFHALSQLAAMGLVSVNGTTASSIPVPSNAPVPFRDYLGTMRFDWSQSPRSQWFVRAAVDSYTTRNALVQQAALPSTGATSHNNYMSLVIGQQFTFNQWWLGSFVFNASGLHLTEARNSHLGFALAFPFTSTPATISGLETFGDNQFITPITAFPILRNQEKYQFRYDVSNVSGSHAPRFGVSFIHEPVMSGALASTAETLTTFALNPTDYIATPQQFSVDLTCTPTATLMVTPGTTCATTPAANGSFSQNVQRLGLYAEDSWRVTRGLTLNYGLRYDTTFGLFTASGQDQTNNPGLLTLKALQIPLVNGVPHDYRAAVAPRLGIAYALGGQQNTVIRAGIGLYYNDLAQNGWVGAFQAVNSPLPGPCVNPGDPGCLPPAATTGPVGTVPGSGSIIDPHYKTPYALHATAGVEHAFTPNWTLSVGWTHEQGVHAYRRYQYQAGFTLFSPLFAPTVTAQRNAVPNITLFRTDNRSSYNAIAVRLQGNLAPRFNLQASYSLASAKTWGCVLGELFDYVNGVCNPLNAFAPGDYGPSGEDVRHRFVLAGNFLVPGGIHLTTLIQAESARPFTLVTTVPDPALGDGFDDRAVVNGAPVSLDGLRGTPYVQMDLRVARPIHFRERWTVAPFIEFFNLFNRNNPGANYVTNIAALPVPAGEVAARNVTDLCTNAACTTTQPITSLKQLRVPGGALGDFFGPGTTVGIPFAAQLGVRVTF